MAANGFTDWLKLGNELRLYKNNYKHESWRFAFNLYNEHNKQKVAMGCSSCYHKV